MRKRASRYVYTVSEGEKIRVDDIHIIGSQQTRNKTVTRNITFHEGDPLSPEQLLTSQQQLYALGLFNRVDVVPVNVKQSDNYRPVIIRLEDSSPIILGYGGGYQDREGPRGTIEISHNNLFGLARSISFRTRASFREQRGQITYKEPRLFNRDLDSFVTLFAERTRRVSFNTTRTNAALQILKRFRAVDNYFVRYNFETVDLSDVRVNPLATGQINLGTLKLSTFSTAWLRDTRDDPIEPMRGFFNTLNFSAASRAYGSQANLLSFFGQSQTYRRVSRNAVLATSLRLGWIAPYGVTPEVPISERFFAGGSTSLRGFGLDEAGPRDPESGAPLGGNALIIANIELRLPVTENLVVAPFYDTGNVFARVKDIKLSSFSNTLGFGFRYKTPFGPLRIDIGFNLSPPERVAHQADFLDDWQPVLRCDNSEIKMMSRLQRLLDVLHVDLVSGRLLRREGSCEKIEIRRGVPLPSPQRGRGVGGGVGGERESHNLAQCSRIRSWRACSVSSSKTRPSTPPPWTLPPSRAQGEPTRLVYSQLETWPVLASSKWPRTEQHLRLSALILCCALLWQPLIGLMAHKAEVIDRLMAVVNGQIITLGDVEQETKMRQLDRIAEKKGETIAPSSQSANQELVVQYLIEQALIREQIQQFPGIEVSDDQIDAQLAAIHSNAGGPERLTALGIDIAEVRKRIQWQLQVMKFVDYRFRQFIVVDSNEIDAYYRNQFLPALQKRNALPAPDLAQVEEQIRKILIEEKLNLQVEEWLASLRKDATIEIFH